MTLFWDLRSIVFDFVGWERVCSTHDTTWYHRHDVPWALDYMGHGWGPVAHCVCQDRAEPYRLYEVPNPAATVFGRIGAEPLAEWSDGGTYAPLPLFV